MYRQGSLSGLGADGITGFLSSVTSAIESGVSTVSADIAALRRIKIHPMTSPIPVLTASAPAGGTSAAGAGGAGGTGLPNWVLPVGAAALIGLLVMNSARKRSSR